MTSEDREQAWAVLTSHPAEVRWDLEGDLQDLLDAVDYIEAQLAMLDAYEAGKSDG